MTDRATFAFPTAIRFGAGVRDEVASTLAGAGVRRPLVVADEGVAALPMATELLAAFDDAGLAPSSFSAFGGNPVASHVLAGRDAYRAHEADGIVGLGGGVALDVAKAVGLIVSNDGELFDYEDGPEARPVDVPLPYWVAIPTTAGTGSEVGRSAVIADDDTHQKKVIFSPALLAPMVFADPELTVGLPASITAATGMDALTHCIEAYLARDYHPICDGVALEGLRLGARSIARCVSHPDDLAARADLLMASMMGAIAFQKGLGVVHSCAHSLSTVADLHHGLANGVVIDHALEFNVVAVPERFEILATTIGAADPTPAAFLAWLTDLKVVLGLPAGLAAVGVGGDEIGRLARLAAVDACHLNNPRPVTESDFRAIFAAAS
jgi:alcohol dehydrogenase class IV